MAKTFKINFKFNIAILRFSNVYGPYSTHKSSAIHQIFKCLNMNKIFMIHGSGKQLRDFIYVENLIKKVIKITQKKHFNGVYNINTKKKIA